MKNSDLNIGVVSAPDKHYKPVLFSEKEASDTFVRMNREISANQKHYSFEETKDTPKLIKGCTFAAILAAAGALLVKKFKK